MNKDAVYTNEVTLKGIVEGEPVKIEREINKHGEKVNRVTYSVTLAVSRLSGYVDKLNIIVDPAVVDLFKDGATVEVKGSVRTRNFSDASGRHLDVYIFANECVACEPITELDQYVNEVKLVGYICKPVNIRELYGKKPEVTKAGYIADLLIAVNRKYYASDYIPAICWRGNVDVARQCKVGSHILVQGRLQHRDYTKKYEDGSSVAKRTYELAIRTIEIMKNEEDGAEVVENPAEEVAVQE